MLSPRLASDDEFENLRIKGPNAVQLVKTTTLKLSPLPPIPDPIREVIYDMLNALAAYHAPEEGAAAALTSTCRPAFALKNGGDPWVSDQFCLAKSISLPSVQQRERRADWPRHLGAKTSARSCRMSAMMCTSITAWRGRAVTLTHRPPSTSMWVSAAALGCSKCVCARVSSLGGVLTGLCSPCLQSQVFAADGGAAESSQSGTPQGEGKKPSLLQSNLFPTLLSVKCLPP